MDLATRYEEQIDPNNPGDWTLVYQSPDVRYWECEVQPGVIVGRTEHLKSDQLIAENQQALKDSEGMKWGEGKIVSSVPLGEWFRTGLSEAAKAGDKRFMNRWLNDHPQYRRFKGTF